MCIRHAAMAGTCFIKCSSAATPPDLCNAEILPECPSTAFLCERQSQFVRRRFLSGYTRKSQSPQKNKNAASCLSIHNLWKCKGFFEHQSHSHAKRPAQAMPPAHDRQCLHQDKDEDRLTATEEQHNAAWYAQVRGQTRTRWRQRCTP